jgi:hypothetical protein
MQCIGALLRSIGRFVLTVITCTCSKRMPLTGSCIASKCCWLLASSGSGPDTVTGYYITSIIDSFLNSRGGKGCALGEDRDQGFLCSGVALQQCCSK